VTGDAPHGFHAANLLLHAGVCALVWFAARRAGVFYGTAILTALLFAVHPVHVEAVANVAGRAELLAAGFALAAWLAHRRHQRLLAPLLYLMAVLSKEGAVLAPVLFVLDDLVRRRDGERPPWVPYAGYAAVLAIALGLRAMALGGLRGAEDAVFMDNPAAFAGPAVRVGTALWVMTKDLFLLVWPRHLVSDYSVDAIPLLRSWSDPRLLAGVAVLAALVTLGVWGWRRSRPLLLGIGIFTLFLLPASNVLFPTGTLMAERLLYLPSFAVCLIAGHLGADLARRGKPALVGAVAAAALLLGLGAARTWTRLPAWSDNATLALTDVKLQPRSAKLQAGAGIALHSAGREEEAEAAYRRALAIWPDYAQIHYNLALLLDERDAEEEAIGHLKEAGRLAPHNPQPFKLLAPRLETLGRTEEALAAYAAGSAADPRDLPFRFNQGRALLAAGKTEAGLAVLEELGKEIDGSYVGLLAEALALETRGDLDGARRLYARVVQLPQVPEGVRAKASARLAGLPSQPPSSAR
jgi:tetratricopeptide (TPR) repeat protein